MPETPRTTEHTQELCRLLTEVVRLAREHGARGEPVRQFIRANAAYPEFKSLAITLVMLKDMFDRRRAERALLGKGPACRNCSGEGMVGEVCLPCEACGGTGDEPDCR